MTLAALLADAPLDPSREEGRRLLEEELSKPRYAVEPSLWDRFREWLFGLFETTGPGLPPWLILVVLAVVLAIVAAVMVALLRPEARARRSGTGGSVLDDRGVDAAAYRQRAKAAAAQGDWDAVVLDGYRAVVAGSVERTILDDLPGRTAYEAALELGARFPAERDGLRTAADRFDDVRYGEGHATEAEARAVLDLDARLARSRPVFAEAAS